MNVVLFGASGMIGTGALLECLDDPRVTSVLAVVRRALDVTHPKLHAVLHPDVFDVGGLRDTFAACDACFFCLGVSSAGMSEADYRHVTYDLTLGAAKVLVAANPAMTFCYISGQGTDSTERGRIMWARVKGATENALLALPFKAVYLFRPGFIQPLRGVRSRTRLYAALYAITAPLFPLLRRLFPRSVTTSVALGRAMIRVCDHGWPRRILEPDEINRAATLD